MLPDRLSDWLKRLKRSARKEGQRRSAPGRASRPGHFCRPVLEELEARLAPATYVVNPQLQVHLLDNVGGAPGSRHNVVFFESSVANYQVLRQGLPSGFDAVILDSCGDGVREMAAFLAGQHNLSAVEVVAHGTSGAVSLGT